jgi:CheY-like chemotaxis protein
MTKPLALIIEDDEDLTIIFSSALEAAGYETEVIMQGDEAWRRLESTLPALMVLDLHLPRVSGLDILRRIRTDNRFAGIRVLAVSADARMAEMARSEADLVLVKPISFGQLRDLSSRFRVSGLTDADPSNPEEVA